MSNLEALPPWVGKLAMSASSMATFRECPRKYELQFLRQLTPDTISVPLFVGDKVHNGLERFYNGDHPREIVEDIQNQIWAELQTRFVGESDMDKVNKDVSIVAGMLLGYFKHYGRKEREATWTDVQVEMGFDFAWDNTIRNWGRMDFAGSYTGDGQFWVMEHKTTGLASYDYLQKWHLGFQPHNYAWAANRAHQLGLLARRPTGVVVNVIKKPGIRLRKTETQEAFNIRLMNEYLENPAKYFAREWIQVTEEDLKWYEQQQGYWVKQLQACYERGEFPQNTDACVSHFGSCKFWPICWGHTRCGDEGVFRYFRVREKQFEEVPTVELTDAPHQED